MIITLPRYKIEFEASLFNRNFRLRPVNFSIYSEQCAILAGRIFNTEKYHVQYPDYVKNVWVTVYDSNENKYS